MPLPKPTRSRSSATGSRHRLAVNPMQNQCTDDRCCHRGSMTLALPVHTPGMMLPALLANHLNCHHGVAMHALVGASERHSLFYWPRAQARILHWEADHATARRASHHRCQLWQKQIHLMPWLPLAGHRPLQAQRYHQTWLPQKEMQPIRRSDHLSEGWWACRPEATQLRCDQKRHLIHQQSVARQIRRTQVSQERRCCPGSQPQY